CLSSLRRLQDWPMPVVVIDNGSRGEEGKQLAEEFGSPVTFVRLAPNRGVPGGYNAAIEWAHRQGATHILLLNNDVIVTDPKMMRYLADAAAPDVAAVGPVIRNPDGTVYSAGGGISLRRGKSRHLSLA